MKDKSQKHTRPRKRSNKGIKANMHTRKITRATMKRALQNTPLHTGYAKVPEGDPPLKAVFRNEKAVATGRTWAEIAKKLHLI